VPSKATASPAFTSKDIPLSAGKLSAVNGCSNARQPLRAWGKYFSNESMVIAESDTLVFIAFLPKENNRGKHGLPPIVHDADGHSPVI